MVFPEGIVVDTTNRTYLTSNVNSLFLAKSQFMRSSEGMKEKLPIKNDEERGKDYFMIRFGVLHKEKALQAPSASVGVFYCQSLQKQAFNGSPIKNPVAFATGLFLCSGGRIRTSDLWVMSPTSYHCSTPQSGCKSNI